jgi:hypothetical protein
LIGRDSVDLLVPAVVPPAAAQPLQLDLKGYDAPEPAYGLHFGELPLLAASLIAPGGEAGAAAHFPHGKVA